MISCGSKYRPPPHMKTFPDSVSATVCECPAATCTTGSARRACAMSALEVRHGAQSGTDPAENPQASGKPACCAYRVRAQRLSPAAPLRNRVIERTTTAGACARAAERHELRTRVAAPCVHGAIRRKRHAVLVSCGHLQECHTDHAPRERCSERSAATCLHSVNSHK